MKRGDVFISARIARSGRDEDGSCRVVFGRHVLRSVRKGVAFVTEQNEWTWVKTGFGKRATWGWATSIPYYYRHSFPVGEGAAKGGYCRTEVAAVKALIRSLRVQRKYWLGEGDAASVAAIDEEAACLKRWLARARDSGSDPEGEAGTAECEGSQSGTRDSAGIAQPGPVL